MYLSPWTAPGHDVAQPSVCVLRLPSLEADFTRIAERRVARAQQAHVHGAPSIGRCPPYAREQVIIVAEPVEARHVMMLRTTTHLKA